MICSESQRHQAPRMWHSQKSQVCSPASSLSFAWKGGQMDSVTAIQGFPFERQSPLIPLHLLQRDDHVGICCLLDEKIDACESPAKV
mmetsp:Transcript_11777/g.28188  ORF Transcript_11777/g.28188 Transcript_11777/m.28188 type:complete len:87 (+) Transcript_11777:684-944(+)